MRTATRVQTVLIALFATNFPRFAQRVIFAQAGVLFLVHKERLLLPQTRQLVGRVPPKELSALVVR